MPDKFPPLELADLHQRLGSALLRLNRPEPAVQHLETSIKLAPNSGKAWFFLGLAQKALQHPAAQSSLLRACELEPDNKAWRQHVAPAELAGSY